MAEARSHGQCPNGHHLCHHGCRPRLRLQPSLVHVLAETCGRVLTHPLWDVVFKFQVHVCLCSLIHWGWVMHICIGKLTIIGSDNGLSPGQCQGIIWTNAGIVLIGLKNKFQWNFYWNLYVFIQEHALENVVWKMTAILSQPQCVTVFNTSVGFLKSVSYESFIWESIVRFFPKTKDQG